MQLRWYQREAVDAVYDHLRNRDGSPCVVIPTGGGKTPVIATICRDAVLNWQGRVAVVAHVKELLEQTQGKLGVVAPDLPVGVYSAGLGQRDLDKPVVVAGIQSIHRKACELGPVNLIIVDEAHCIPCEDDGMYNRFITDARVVNPGVRVIGMTATPFRLKSGLICAPGNVLNHVCYEVGIKPLIADGFLCPLRSKAGRSAPDTGALHMRGGEFVAGEAEDLMDDDSLVATACAEVAALTAERRGVLIFCAGVRHCEHVVRELATSHGLECGMITAQTPKAERSAVIARFKSGGLKYLANVNVLTTGFDATHIDCVVLLRPTASTGLYYQMVGRGFRPDPGKRDCVVLDYGGNVERHGPVDELNINQLNFNGGGPAPAKQCPECDAVVSAGYGACPECGYEFPDRTRTKHGWTASTDAILSAGPVREQHEVLGTTYAIHHKRHEPGAPPTMRVTHRIGLAKWATEWVCFEHAGFPRRRAERWWKRRSAEPVPATVQDAVERARAGALAPTSRVTIESRASSKFDEIVASTVGEMPRALECQELPEYIGGHPI